ncbi:MAG TPA: hypothetical protein VJH34_01710 [archaeon]|nr:hypothetical protein [archaeon]
MKVYIVNSLIGTFAVDDGNKVVSFRPFPKDMQVMISRFTEADNRLLKEEKELYEELEKRGYKHIVFSKRKPGVQEFEENNSAEAYVKEHLFELSLKHHFVKDRLEFNQLLTKTNIEMTKSDIKKSVKRDVIIMQVNRAMEEIDKSVNIFVERLREWYGLHFPEINRNVESHERFVKLVEKFGSRDKIDEEHLKKLAEKSIGIELSHLDVAEIQAFAAQIRSLNEIRERLSKYLESVLKEMAPNLSEIAGTSIASKLISKAGGIDRLAKMTSNTIQLLGSEKALFRFLHSRGNNRSPKYGIIFFHPLIQGSPDEKRGKLARVLASKISMAAKIDFFSKDDRSKEMKKELDAKVKEVLESKDSDESRKNKV